MCSAALLKVLFLTLIKVFLLKKKQLLDEVFAISGIIKTLIVPDIAKTESNNCFIIHCLTGKQNNGKQFQHLCPSCLPASERFFRGTVPSQFLSAFFCFPSLFVSAIFQFLARLKKRIDEP